MPIEEGIKYGFTADVGGAVSGINKLGNSLDNLGARSKRTQQLAFSFNQVLREAPAFAISASTGILALSNNLPILFDNFSAARKEGLSLKDSLISLGSQFFTVGGILSIATLALTLFASNAAKAGKEAKDASLQIKTANDLIAESTGSVQGEISRLNALSSAVLDTNKSYQERNRALNELKSINKEYFGDLTVESSQYGKLKSLVDEYTNALVANAVVKGFEGEISKISQEIFKQERVVNEAAKSLDFYKKAVVAANSKALKELPKGMAAVNTEAVNASTQFDAANKKYSEQVTILNNLKKSYTDLNEGIKTAVDRSLKFKDTKPFKGEKESADKFSDSIELVNGKLQLLFAKRADTLNPLLKQLQENGKAIFTNTLPVLSESQKKLREYYESLAQVQAFVAGGLTSAFQGFWDTLLQGGNAFGSFFNILGNIIKRLIAATLAAASLALILSFIPGFNIGGLASGGGLSKFGSLFKSFGKSFGIPGFATGGIVTGPTLAMVGEGRGPEAIIPLDKLGQLMGNLGGGRQQVEVIGKVSGPDLIFAMANAKKQSNRIYGQ